MDVVIYTRFSSNNQTEHSTERQINDCKRYAEQHNFNVIKIYTDEAKSGKKDNREAFQQMIEDSEKKEFQGVLIYATDRFARNKYDSVYYKRILRENGVRVFSVCENISDEPSGVIVESIFEGMAEFYSLELAQKVQKGMGLNAEKGYYNGGIPPLGYKAESIAVPLGANGKTIYKKRLVVDEEKAPIIKKIFEMYINDNTMADIIRFLNKKEIKTSYGNEFNKNSIRTIILNKKYIGIDTFKGKEIPNRVPPIIDEDIFYKAQEKLLKNKEAPARARAKTEYLLTTKLFCGTCKDMMVGISGRSGNGTQHCYYGCKNTIKHKCTRKNIKKDYIEDIVVDLARSELTEENINDIAKQVYETAYKKQDETNIKHLQREILNLEDEKKNLLSSLKLCSDDDVKNDIIEELSRIKHKKIQLENEIKEEQDSLFLFTENEIKYFLKSLQNGNKNDMKYRQMLVNVLIYKVYLYDNNITIIYNSNGKSVEKNIPNINELEYSLQAQKSVFCSNKGKNAQPVTNLFELFMNRDINIILKRMVFFLS